MVQCCPAFPPLNYSTAQGRSCCTAHFIELPKCNPVALHFLTINITPELIDGKCIFLQTLSKICQSQPGSDISIITGSAVNSISVACVIADKDAAKPVMAWIRYLDFFGPKEAIMSFSGYRKVYSEVSPKCSCLTKQSCVNCQLWQKSFRQVASMSCSMLRATSLSELQYF